MMRILLTGGRAPATLELARLFDAAGHQVFMAESMKGYLSWPSRAIVRHYIVPPPNRVPEAYLSELVDIVQREKIDLLVPTCEELFYVARGRERLASHCMVFVEGLERLRSLHNKWLFFQGAESYGLKVPHTRLLTSAAEGQALLAAGGKMVLKPVYSRFAAKTIILNQDHDRVLPIHPSSQEPWLAQDFIEGRQICTYSVVHRGQIVAHTAYPTEFRAGQGATILFRHLDHPASFEWVKHFVAQEGFTGQIAFDFIENPVGTLFALECNPRATSGIHLLANNPLFAQTFFDKTSQLVTPLDHHNQPAMLASAMLLYALPAIRSWGALKQWLAAFRSSRDVIWSPRDPLPALLQWVGVTYFVWLSLKHGISSLEASTFDIEWNGE